jgi:hypothetical protein
MNAPRTAPELAWSKDDPRWRFMVAGMQKLYSELDHGDRVRQVTVSFEDPDFGVLVYAISPDETEPRRYLLTDPDVADEAFDRAYVDVTPADTPSQIGDDAL